MRNREPGERENFLELSFFGACRARVDRRDPAGSQHASDFESERPSRLAIKMTADRTAGVDQIEAPVGQGLAIDVAESFEDGLSAKPHLSGRAAVVVVGL